MKLVPALILLALLLVASAAEGASDYRETIQASEILTAIERGEPVEYDDVIVEGDLELEGLDLSTEHVERTEYEIVILGLPEEAKVVDSSISITNSEIRGDVMFGNAIFQEEVDFENTNFTGDAWFLGSNFNENANFRYAVFSGGNANFRYAMFSGGNAYFTGAVFSGGDALFVRTEFSGGYTSFFGTTFSSGDAYFTVAEFSGGDADFQYAKFSGGDAYFTGAVFSGGDAYFGGAQFSDGYADFQDAKFSGGTASFSNAVFSDGYADFRYAKFSGGDANFGGAEFSGRNAYFAGAVFSGGDANFYGAEFSGGDASFKEAEFKEITQFSNVTFNLSASLNGAQFSKRAYFSLATFNGSASFEDAQFSGNAYFEDTTFRGDLNLNRTGYARLFLRWSSINDSQLSASDYDAYLALMRNYVNLGWFEDSNNCYYEYRNKHRREEPISIETVTDTLEWLFYGYGVKPLWTAGWIVGLVLAFGLVFRNGGSIEKYVAEKRKTVVEDEKGWGKFRTVELTTTLKEAHIDIKDPFLFSLTTFTSGLTSFLYPTIQYEAAKHTRLVIFERLLGSIFLALLITAITKTWLIR